MRQQDRSLAIVVLCVLALLQCLSAGGQTTDRKRATRVAQAIGPKAVWKPAKADAEALQARYDNGERCSSAMQALGASSEAVALSQLVGGDGYMESFRECGKVDLALVFFPNRANDNWQYFLVNGTPRLVDVSDIPLLKRIEDVELPRNQIYRSLLGRFPQLLVWESDNEFVSVKRNKEGGQAFTFAYHLNNGCHADWTGYVAQVGISFNRGGQLQGARLLQVAKQSRS